MAYDEQLAERVRDTLGPLLPETVEKKMFGGLGFMLGGNMAVAVSGQGGLLVRVDLADSDMLLTRPGVETMAMAGRESKGWLRVTTETVEDDHTLTEWVNRGVACAQALPPKKAKQPK